MKKIKFRAWTDKGIMITPCLWTDKDNHFVGEDYTNNQFGTVLDLMQFTGHTDINGREIYDQDIYKSGMTGAIYLVYWNKEYFAWFKKCVNINKDDIFMYQDNCSSIVVGNVYENPELLEEL